MISPSETSLSETELQRLNSLAEEVDIESIVIGERVRRDFSHVPDLAESIKEEGLIQPIVLTYDRRLIAGESRIRACKLLGLKTIRAVYRGVLDEAQLVVLEATENNARQNLTWQERVLSIDKVHRLRSTNATLRGESWGVRETGRLLNLAKSPVGRSVLVAEYLHANDPEIWKAESLQDAFRVLTARREREVNASIVQQTLGGKDPSGNTGQPATKYTGPVAPKDARDSFFDGDDTVETFQPGVGGVSVDVEEMPGSVGKLSSAAPTNVPLSSMLLFEPSGTNSLACFEGLGEACTKHIITDPPYAIDMAMLNQSNPNGSMRDIETTEKEHTVQGNVDLIKKFFPLAYRAMRDGGFLVAWCDPTWWWDWCNQAEAAGFRVQRWPLIWQKTSACQNQAAQTNFTKNFEFAVVARKGVATLNKQQPSSIWTGGNDIETKLLGHPFAKPAGLWTWVYDAICTRGDDVLEPFMGCGSAILPAVSRGLRIRGIECNKEHYDRAVVNVSGLYKSLDPTLTFS